MMARFTHLSLSVPVPGLRQHKRLIRKHSSINLSYLKRNPSLLGKATYHEQRSLIKRTEIKAYLSTKTVVTQYLTQKLRDTHGESIHTSVTSGEGAKYGHMDVKANDIAITTRSALK